MKIDTIIIAVSIIIGAWLMRPPKKTDELNKHLLNDNKSLYETIIDREKQINQIKIDIIKSHENEKEIINNIPNAPVHQLDSIWARFFNKYSD